MLATFDFIHRGFSFLFFSTVADAEALLTFLFVSFLFIVSLNIDPEISKMVAAKVQISRTAFGHQICIYRNV